MEVEKTAVKTPDEILRDLEGISPLALPEYLHRCEYFDRSDAFEQLEKAIEEFEGKGGVAKSIMESTMEAVVNSIGLVLLRKFNEPLYKKTVKTKSSVIEERIYVFNNHCQSWLQFCWEEVALQEITNHTLFVHNVLTNDGNLFLKVLDLNKNFFIYMVFRIDLTR